LVATKNKAKFYEESQLQITGYRALRLIPPGASVVAQDDISPHLSDRESIYELDRRSPNAEFVVACSGLSPWPNANAAAVRGLLKDFVRQGYATVFQADGWTVLKRVSMDG